MKTSRRRRRRRTRRRRRGRRKKRKRKIPPLYSRGLRQRGFLVKKKSNFVKKHRYLTKFIFF